MSKRNIYFYEELIQAIFVLAVDAVTMRDLGQTTAVEDVARSVFAMVLADKLDGVSSLYEIIESTDLSTVKNLSESIWDWCLNDLKDLPSSYPEILSPLANYSPVSLDKPQWQEVHRKNIWIW